ncbi:MAG TPA: helix-turn-helix domain-containing protein, partial [Thermomicrobiales bacterium]|nr:helix-turn-helix domain-containing protein [Thermomicrobiales bacterium]
MSGERERGRAPVAEPRGAVLDLRPPAFGELLRRFRRAAGLTQEQLAERSGLSAAGISALERGARASPQRETVRLLADALALAPAERARLAAAVAPRQAPNAGGSPPPRLPGLVPLAAGELIGRDDDVRAVDALLAREGVRLVTIAGPGGVGKTRLALAVAARCRARHRDGVTVLALDTLRAAEDALPLLARRLGLGDRHRGPLLEAVVAALRERRIVLVLDNLEQLLPFAGTAGAILSACPGVRVLATSRAALRAPWETRYPLGPLALPDAAARDRAAIA